MKKTLVTYATIAGSTADIARAVAEEITRCDAQVEVLALSQAKEIESYDIVVVGASMIMGWYRQAIKFLGEH